MLNGTPPLFLHHIAGGLPLTGEWPSNFEQRFAWASTLTSELLIPELRRVRAIADPVEHLERRSDPVSKRLDQEHHIDFVAGGFPITVKSSWVTFAERSHDSFRMRTAEWERLRTNRTSGRLAPTGFVQAIYRFERADARWWAALHAWRMVRVDALIEHASVASTVTYSDGELVTWPWRDLEAHGVVMDPRPGLLAA